MTASAKSGGTADPSARHRLSYDVRPEHYDIRVAPDLEAATFSGSVRIDATVVAPTDRIELHAQDLDIGSVSVTAGGQTTAATIDHSEHEDRVVLKLATKLEPGEASISLDFTGVLNDMLCGFYRSTFTAEDGTTHTIATTQFEATDARRAFPCFDEPDRKASFAVTLDVPAGAEGYSNGPLVGETSLENGRRRLEFGTTIKMSTYLVAFVVGPLVATEPVDVDGVAVRVVHVPGRQEMTAFALEVAAHSLRYFTDFFGLPYPGQKVDLVAIPDFAAGAMENLGCITFREPLLLIDPDKASPTELERVSDVIAHELAHMWFGDLVTMKWWNGIWLNEAFATLMEMLCVDAFRPQWQRWVSFGLEREAAMAVDALHRTRPVEYPVGPPEEAQGMFDLLTYQKGAAVLRMLEQFLGESVFRQGIQQYLADHQLANTDTPDLWRALGQASGAPVEHMMDGWILRGGFPLVHAGRRGAALTLSQEPFAYAPADGPSAIGHSWQIPVSIRTMGATTTEKTVLLGETAATVDVGADDAVVVNADGRGFFRVRYDVEGLARLAPVLSSLGTLERCYTVSDTWASVVVGGTSLEDALALGERLRSDDDPDVWAQLSRPLQFLDYLVDEDGRQLLGRYTRTLAAPAFDSLGWRRRPGDSDRTATLRGQLLGLLGTVGADPDVRRRCLDEHRAACQGGPALEPDLAPAVAGVVAAAGGDDEFEMFVNRIRQASTPQEEVRYLYALAGFQPAHLAERAFTMAVEEARNQNGPYLVQLLLANRSNGAATWRRLTDRWDEVVARFPANTVPRMLDAVKQLCTDAALAEDVRAFLAAHPLPSGQRMVEQSVERLGINLRLASRLRTTAAADLAAGVARLSAP